jgi:hypothetical protein
MLSRVQRATVWYEGSCCQGYAVSVISLRRHQSRHFGLFLIAHSYLDFLDRRWRHNSQPPTKLAANHPFGRVFVLCELKLVATSQFQSSSSIVSKYDHFTVSLRQHAGQWLGYCRYQRAYARNREMTYWIDEQIKLRYRVSKVASQNHPNRYTMCYQNICPCRIGIKGAPQRI